MYSSTLLIKWIMINYEHFLQRIRGKVERLLISVLSGGVITLGCWPPWCGHLHTEGRCLRGATRRLVLTMAGSLLGFMNSLYRAPWLIVTYHRWQQVPDNAHLLRMCKYVVTFRPNSLRKLFHNFYSYKLSNKDTIQLKIFFKYIFGIPWFELIDYRYDFCWTKWWWTKII